MIKMKPLYHKVYTKDIGILESRASELQKIINEMLDKIDMDGRIVKQIQLLFTGQYSGYVLVILTTRE